MIKTVTTLTALALTTVTAFDPFAMVMQSPLFNLSDADPITRALPPPTMYQMCGVDILGGDFLSKPGPPEACPQMCDSNKPMHCDAVTWTNFQGGTCWLKSLDLNIQEMRTSASAISYMRFQQPGDPVAMGFQGKTNADMQGYDLGSLPGKAITDCVARCTENTKCFAVTWTDFQSGTCWLKSRASELSTKSNVQSVFVGRKVNSGAVCPRL